MQIVLWQHIAWLSLHSGWHEPQRQHDVIEYLGHTGQLAKPSNL